MRRLAICLLLCAGTPLGAQDSGKNDSNTSLINTLRGWFQTPEQQAQRAWRDGDIERLTAVAPSDEWQGVASYEKGDFASAAEAFGRASAATANATGHAIADDFTNNSADAAVTDAASSFPTSLSTAKMDIKDADVTRQFFNQATTNIQLGKYADAIDQLDTLLEQHPAHSEAARNRAIAERLLELQQQTQQSEGGQGDQSEDPESGEPSDSNDENSDNGEAGSEGDDSENPADSAGSEGEGESSDAQPPASESADNANAGAGDDSNAAGEAQSDEEIDAAREALRAQAREGAPSGEENTDPDSEESAAVAAGANAEPLSEQDQATEQWLRQIPDDPDDLLRRKLLQNHRNEFPDVQRHGQGW